MADTKSIPLSPFISLVCLQLQGKARVKTPRTLEVACFGTSHRMLVLLQKLYQILKFHERVILVVNSCE